MLEQIIGRTRSTTRHGHGHLRWALAIAPRTHDPRRVYRTLYSATWSRKSGTSSSIANLKELRPGTVRILFVFDPWRSSILLVAGDKAGQWNAWYRQAIPLAEQRYELYLKERAQQEGGQP
ncbi:type II toxin-antitoxin system RelE/ParE family toxin [Micromonospora sp. NPDC050200]|uniref:type II toxin-antitoxin system RelE/ParE family toxin n=1 Tax=Micromonospora sp. NPDC050200 TaxID=3155664 RepID=UPI0033C70BBB